MRSRRTDVAAAAALMVVSVAVYGSIARLWWTLDDPFHLNLIRPSSVWDLFFSPEVWQETHSFTPLLLASLKFDLSIFGLNPAAFYVHQLLMFGVFPILLYCLLRLWLPVTPSLLAAAIAIFGTPSAQIVQQLMLRHYVEGLAAGLASAISFVVAVRRGNRSLSILSAAAYLVSCLAKEVYAPLPALFLVLPAGSARERLRHLQWHVVAAAVYVAWRWYVAGAALKGYGWTARLEDWPALIATLPVRTAAAITDGSVSGMIVAVVLAVCALVALVRGGRNGVVLAFVAVTIALAPIAVVSIEMQPRYALVTWLILVAAAASAAITHPRVVPIALAIALIGGVVNNRLYWNRTFSEARRMSIEAQTLATLRESDLLWRPSIPPAAIAELKRLQGSPARWSYDLLPLCRGTIRPERVFTYANGEMRQQPVAAVRDQCNRIAPAAALNVEFSYEDGSLYWQFGPYADGTWHVVIADGLQGFPVPRSGAFRLPQDTTLPVRVRYDAPEGWSAYSADLSLRLQDGAQVKWQR